jgi:hypothetical protein
MTRAEKRDQEFQRIYKELLNKGERPNVSLRETRRIINDKRMRPRI